MRVAGVSGEAVIVGYAGGASGASAAARRGATVVVVDAFRASATISVLVSLGAEVVPLSSIEEAAVYPADLRVGERDGAKVPGFDFGNSPTEVLASGVETGQTVAMSTTNGTRIVEASAGAAEILAGCFVNAGAVADYLTASGSREAVVVGCGWRGRRSSEDEAGAGAILSRLTERGATPDSRAAKVIDSYHEYLRKPKSTILVNSASRRLLRLGYENDIRFCLEEDTVPVVPILEGHSFIEAT